MRPIGRFRLIRSSQMSSSVPAASCSHEASDTVVCGAACGLSACPDCAADGAHFADDDVDGEAANPFQIDIAPFRRCSCCERSFCEGCADNQFWGCETCERAYCDKCFVNGALMSCSKCYRFDDYPRCCWQGGFCDNCSEHLCMKSPCSEYVNYCSVAGCQESGCSSCCIIFGCDTCRESFCPVHTDIMSCEHCYASFCVSCDHTCPRK